MVWHEICDPGQRVKLRSPNFKTWGLETDFILRILGTDFCLKNGILETEFCNIFPAIKTKLGKNFDFDVTIVQTMIILICWLLQIANFSQKKNSYLGYFNLPQC